jgi:hypothetical protein
VRARRSGLGGLQCSIWGASGSGLEGELGGISAGSRGQRVWRPAAEINSSGTDRQQGRQKDLNAAKQTRELSGKGFRVGSSLWLLEHPKDRDSKVSQCDKDARYLHPQIGTGAHMKRRSRQDRRLESTGTPSRSTKRAGTLGSEGGIGAADFRTIVQIYVTFTIEPCPFMAWPPDGASCPVGARGMSLRVLTACPQLCGWREWRPRW